MPIEEHYGLGAPRQNEIRGKGQGNVNQRRRKTGNNRRDLKEGFSGSGTDRRGMKKIRVL